MTWFQSLLLILGSLAAAGIISQLFAIRRKVDDVSMESCRMADVLEARHRIALAENKDSR